MSQGNHRETPLSLKAFGGNLATRPRSEWLLNWRRAVSIRWARADAPQISLTHPQFLFSGFDVQLRGPYSSIRENDNCLDCPNAHAVEIGQK